MTLIVRTDDGARLAMAVGREPHLDEMSEAARGVLGGRRVLRG